MLRRHKERKPEKNGQNFAEDIPMHAMHHMHIMRKPPRMRTHPRMGRHPMAAHRRFSGRRMDLLEELENKDEAIEHLEYRKKLLTKQKRRLYTRMEHLEILNELFDQSIKDVAKLEEYSSEEMRKILRKTHREYDKKIVDRDDW